MSEIPSNIITPSSILKNNKIGNKPYYLISSLIAMFILMVVLKMINPNFLTSSEQLVTDPSYSVVNGNTYTNTKLKLKVVFPENWKITNENGLEDQIQSAVLGTNSIKISAIKQDAEYQNKDISTDLTLERFVATIEKTLDSVSGSYKIISSSKVTLAKNPAYWVKYAANRKGFDPNLVIVTTQYQFLHNGYLYMVSGATKVQDWNDISPQIENSINSLSFY